MLRQHKRLQRAKFLSAVGKEETGAVVYREVGRLSPHSPFSPPCRQRMTATLRPRLPLNPLRFFLLGLYSASLHGPLCHPWGGFWEVRRWAPDPTAGCQHLCTSPRSLRNNRGEESQQRWRAKHMRLQLKLAQAPLGCGAWVEWCTAQCPPCVPRPGNPSAAGSCPYWCSSLAAPALNSFNIISLKHLPVMMLPKVPRGWGLLPMPADRWASQLSGDAHSSV